MNKISKILLIFILAAAILLTATACSGDDDEIELDYANIESITVNDNSISNGFLLDDFDISKVILDVKYKSTTDEKGHEVIGETVQIPAKLNMVKAEDKPKLSVPGSKTITLVYNKFVISFVLTLYKEEIVKYNVTFLDEEGNLLGEIQRVAKGGTARQPTYPTKTGYDFIGWTDRNTNNIVSYSNVQSELVLQATYAPKAYSVTFYTVIENYSEKGDGEVGGGGSTTGTVRTQISKVNIPRGESALDYAPEIPVIPGYSNGRWENENAMAVIDGSVTEFDAIYDRDTISVVFNYKKESDISTDFLKNYFVGDTIEEGFDAEPKSGKYKFIGWYTSQEIWDNGKYFTKHVRVEFPYTVKSEMRFEAQYIDLSEGNVTFKTDDGGSTYYVSGLKEDLPYVDGQTSTVDGTISNNSGIIVIPKLYNQKPVTGIAKGRKLFDISVREFVVSDENEYFKVEDGVLYDFDKENLLIFPDSGKVSEIALPQEVRYIYDYAFADAAGLNKISFNEGLINIGKYAFKNCSGIEKLEFPETLKKIDEKAFYTVNKSSIAGIVFNGEPSITEIGLHAFDGLNKLAEFNLPASVTTIYGGFLSNCVNLDKITVDESNTNFIVDENSGILYDVDKQTIYAYPANNKGKNISEVVIPESVVLIKEGAFSYSRIQGITFKSDITLETNSISTPYLSTVRILGEKFEYSDASRDGDYGSIFGNDFIPQNFYAANPTIKNNLSNYYSSSKISTYDEDQWVEMIDYDGNFMYKVKNFTDASGNTVKEIIIVGAKNTKAVMEIPATLTKENYNVTEIGPSAFYGDININKIILPNAITKIGEKAFAEMPYLTEVVLNDNLKEISDQAFYNSVNLSTISYGEGLALENVGKKAFENTRWYLDDSNELLTLNNWLIKYNGYDVSAEIPYNIKYIASEAFLNKTNLTSVSFGKQLNNAVLEFIGENAFENCTSLRELALPKTIKTISEFAFKDCNKLILLNLDISKDNLADVSIGYMALPDTVTLRCTENEESSYRLIYHLEDGTESEDGVIFVEPLDVEDNANRRFAGWYEKDKDGNLTDLVVFPLTLNDENTVEEGAYRTKSIYAKFIEINNGEGGTAGIKYKLNEDNTYIITGYEGTDRYVVIPKKYKGKAVTAIADGAFEDKDIITFALPYSIGSQTGDKISDITYIGQNAFDGTIWYESFNGDYVIVHNVLVRYKGTASLVEIPENINIIADGAFYNNDHIVKVVIPEGVTELGKNIFYGCDNLESIELPKKLVTIGDNVFGGDSASGYCSNLGNINFEEAKELSLISNNAAENTKWLLSVIDDCIYINNTILYKYQGKMSVLTIPNGILQIADNAFMNNKSLNIVNIPQSVEYIGKYAFAGSLVNLINIFSSGSKLASIDSYAFAGCKNLEGINIKSAKTLSYIGEYAFQNTHNLTEITIPSTVTSLGKGVFSGSYAGTIIFASNSKLKSLPDEFCSGNTQLSKVIFNGASTLSKIGATAFNGCKNMELFRNPNANIVSIGEEAFKDCQKLKNLETNLEYLNYIGIDALDNMGYINSYNSKMIILGGVLIKYDGDESVVTIPDSIYTIYDGAFKGKTALEEIIFGEESLIESINDEAFADCTNLVKVNFPEKIKNVGNDVMRGTKWLEDCQRDENKEFIIIGKTLIQYKGKEKQIVIPDYISVLNKGAFAGIELYNITLNGNVTTIKEGAFDGIIRPKIGYIIDASGNIIAADETLMNWSITINPKDNDLSENPIKIGANEIPVIYVANADIKEAFYLDLDWEAYDGIIKIADYHNIIFSVDAEKGEKVSSITEFMLYKEKEPVTKEGYVFVGWFLDEEYNIPLKYPLIVGDTLTVYAKFASMATGTTGGVFVFDDSEHDSIVKYTGNKDVTIVCPAEIQEKAVVKFGGMFTKAGGDETATHVWNESTQKYEIPNDPNDATHLYKGAFEGHKEISKFYFADNANITTIGKNSFKNCTSLQSIILPATVTMIEEGAFEGCTSLTKIEFGNGADAMTISENAFKGCTALSTITLPDKIVLENGAFKGCSSLIHIYVNNTDQGNIRELGSGILPFDENNGLKIYVKKTVYDSYKNRWAYYKDLIEVQNEE